MDWPVAVANDDDDDDRDRYLNQFTFDREKGHLNK